MSDSPRGNTEAASKLLDLTEGRYKWLKMHKKSILASALPPNRLNSFEGAASPREGSVKEWFEVMKPRVTKVVDAIVYITTWLLFVRRSSNTGGGSVGEDDGGRHEYRPNELLTWRL